MTITLSEDTENRLLAEAKRRGLEANQLAEQLIGAALSRPVQPPANQESIQILDEWESEDATDDPAELARRQAEFEDFKRELNRTRLATDGPDARVPYLTFTLAAST